MTIGDCWGKCGATEGLVEVLFIDDPSTGQPAIPQQGFFCEACLASYGGMRCPAHGFTKKLARVAAMGEYPVRHSTFCAHCLAKQVRELPMRERGRLASLIGETGTAEEWRAVAALNGKGWYHGLSIEGQVLAGLMLGYAPYLDPGDTVEDVVRHFLAQAPALEPA